MPPADPGQSEYEADARGIMQCLRMLTEEAAGLRLAGTCEALRRAIEICALENGLAPPPETAVADAADGPAILH
jgi:hypothetical protein